MAIKGDKARSVSFGGKDQMTLEDFKKWLMKFDSDKDGRINQKDLRDAVRSRGIWFSWRKSRRGLIEADINGDGYIDEQEIDDLLDFAETNLGFKFDY